MIGGGNREWTEKQQRGGRALSRMLIVCGLDQCRLLICMPIPYSTAPVVKEWTVMSIHYEGNIQYG